MPSRPRDPQEPFEFFEPDSSPPRTFASHPSDRARKPFSASRLESISQTEAFRKRPATLRLPAIDPTTLHTRATLPRISAARQERVSEEESFQPPPTASDLWLIPGPTRPGAGRPVEQRGLLSIRWRVQLTLLVLTLLVLLGAQGFVAHLAGECVASQQSCLSLSMLQTLSGSQASKSSTAATMSGAMLPAIPNDLPDNVRSFIQLALPYAVQAHQTLGWPTSVVLAQWGLEHGWSVPDAQGYNWGNTTYAPGCPYQGSRFCYAATPAEGLREYVYTAQLSYYMGIAPAAKQGGADAAAQELGRSPWDAGHYTSTSQPGASLLTIMHNFNFYRFDVGG